MAPDIKLTVGRIYIRVEVDASVPATPDAGDSEHMAHGAVLFGFDEPGQIRVEGATLLRLLEIVSDEQKGSAYQAVTDCAAAALHGLLSGYLDGCASTFGTEAEEAAKCSG